MPRIAKDAGKFNGGNRRRHGGRLSAEIAFSIAMGMAYGSAPIATRPDFNGELP